MHHQVEHRQKTRRSGHSQPVQQNARNHPDQRHLIAVEDNLPHIQFQPLAVVELVPVMLRQRVGEAEHQQTVEQQGHLGVGVAFFAVKDVGGQRTQRNMVRQESGNGITSVIQAALILAPSPDQRQAPGQNVQQNTERRQPDQFEHRFQSPDAESGHCRKQKDDSERNHPVEQPGAVPGGAAQHEANNQGKDHVNKQGGELSGNIHRQLPSSCGARFSGMYRQRRKCEKNHRTCMPAANPCLLYMLGGKMRRSGVKFTEPG